jgi:hypothetical protein
MASERLVAGLQEFNTSLPFTMPISRNHTLKFRKAQSSAQRLITETTESWKTLLAILQQHESTIQKRWSKKANKQRKAVLLAAWPGIKEYYSRDLALYESGTCKKLGDTQRDATIFSHINLDDLSDNYHFLLFLHSRGWYEPQRFVDWIRRVPNLLSWRVSWFPTTDITHDDVCTWRARQDRSMRRKYLV